MISGRVQIDSFAEPKATGAVANGKSPMAAADVAAAFHQHLRDELGKLTGCLPGNAHPARGDETAKSLSAGKPAKKQTATSLPERTNAADETTSSPPHLPFFPSDPPPHSPGMTNGSPASAAQPDPRVVTENAGRVDSAAQETLSAGYGKSRLVTLADGCRCLRRSGCG